MTQVGFANWLTIISVLGMISSIYLSIIDKEDENERKKLIKIMVALILALTVISGLFMRYYKFKPDTENLTTEEMLKKAEDYYKIGNYYNAIMLYTNKQLETNPIALSNLGYMYEHGYGVVRSIETAKNYYYKASMLDEKENCFENYIISVIKYPKDYDEIIGALSLGMSLGSDICKEFILSVYPKWTKETDEERIELFMNLPLSDKIEFFNYAMYEKRISELEYVGIADNIFSYKEIGWHTNQEVIGKIMEHKADGTVENSYVTGNRSIAINIIVQKCFEYGNRITTKFITVSFFPETTNKEGQLIQLPDFCKVHLSLLLKHLPA